MSATALYRSYALPWELAVEQDRCFRATLRKVGIAVAAVAVVLSLLPVPEIPPDELEPVPPRFARLLLDKPAPPPPPPVPVERPEPVRETTPAEQPVDLKLPAPVPEVPADRAAQARKKASVAGLLPFADQLADLRDNQAVASVTADRQLAGAAGSAERAERSLITARAGRASSGINTAALSRDTGGAGLAGRDATRVSSTVAGLAAAGPEVQRSGPGDRPARSREEIELVFDQNKGAIYALYNRALRRDPTLQGKLVLKLTIEPTGEVSLCEVVSSDLSDADLERKLIQRVKLFRFAEKDVAPVTTTKPIDFFPA
jgi:outer membrane biosynthesis protein TonB